MGPTPEPAVLGGVMCRESGAWMPALAKAVSIGARAASAESVSQRSTSYDGGGAYRAGDAPLHCFSSSPPFCGVVGADSDSLGAPGRQAGISESCAELSTEARSSVQDGTTILPE